MSKSIKIENLSNEIEKELTLYSEEITEQMKKQANKSMKELVEQSKASAPVGHSNPHYRDYIKSKKKSENNRGVIYLWYLRKKGGLSHLLNDGHNLWNSTKRVKGTNFLTNAYEKVETEFIKQIEKIIEDS